MTNVSGRGASHRSGFHSKASSPQIALSLFAASMPTMTLVPFGTCTSWIISPFTLRTGLSRGRIESSPALYHMGGGQHTQHCIRQILTSWIPPKQARSCRDRRQQRNESAKTAIRTAAAFHDTQPRGKAVRKAHQMGGRLVHGAIRLSPCEVSLARRDFLQACAKYERSR